MKIFKFILILYFLLGLEKLSAFEITKSPSDYRKYSFLELENGFKFIVVSDPAINQNYCSITIGAGSFNDPEDLQGLAHLLEHTLFLGTEKYPTPDLFKHAVSENGGYFNARTNSESTDFFYSVNSNALEKTISILSNAFLSPLFIEKYIEREKHVVDEEYRMHLNSDAYKVVDVYKEISNPQHPYHRFNMGSLDSFPKDNHYLKLRLKEFFERNYCSNKMTLCLIGPQSIEYLSDIVKKHFSAIPKHQCSNNQLPLIFEKANKNLDIAIKSQNSDSLMLILMYVLPKNNIAYYENGSLNFLKHLIESKAKNSLYSSLKNKGYITNLKIDVASFSTEEIFSIIFDLTSLGYSKKDEITSIFLYFLEMLKEHEYPKVFYNDLLDMRSLRWKHIKYDSSLDFAINLSTNLQKYSPEKAVIGNVLIEHPDYEQNIRFINQSLKQFKNENLRRIIIAPDVEVNKHTNWFNAEYSVKPLSDIKRNIASIKSIKKENLFPPKNKYIQKDPVCKDFANQGIVKVPKKIFSNLGIDLWYLNDGHNQNGAFSSLYFNFATKEVSKSARAVALSHLFVKSMEYELEKEIFNTLSWASSFSIYQHPRGISFKLYGFSSIQPKIAQDVNDHMKAGSIDQNTFLVAKENLIKLYKNKLSLFDKTRTRVFKTLQQPQYDEDEVSKEIASLTYEEFLRFVQIIRSDWHIEALVNGNYTTEEAIELANFSNCKNATKAPGTLLKMTKLSSNAKYYEHVPPEPNSHAISLYVQIAESPKSAAETIILNKLLEKKFYSYIRTEEKLGYAVTTDTLINENLGGMVFSIQSSHNPSILYKKIMNFLKNEEKTIKALSLSELNQVKETLILNLTESKSNREKSDTLFSQIEGGNFEFDDKGEMIKTIKKITCEDVRKCYQELISTNSSQLIIATGSPLEKNSYRQIKGRALN